MKEAAAPPAVTHEPELRQPAEVKPDSSACTRLNRSFAGVPVVADRPDDGNAAAIEALLGHLASQLGLRPGQVKVRLDRAAEVIVSQRGADGAASQGVVYLRSETFDPTSRSGRRLLAHETAHAAQALLPQAAAEPGRRRHLAAELEAEKTAELYVATRTAVPVRVPLAPSALAFNTGVDALVEPVKQSRGAEIARIIDLLSYGVFDWAVTDGDVFDVLHILNSFPLVTSRAIARNIGRKYRERLFGNLKPPHYSDYRAEILAVAWAAESEDEFEDENYQILNRISLTDLDPLEAVAVDAIVTLSPNVKAEAEADSRRAARIAEAQKGAKSEAGGKALSAAVEEAQAEEQKVIEAKAITDSSLDALAKQIRERLDEFHVSDEEALDLLDEIARQCLPFLDPTDKFQALANALSPKVLDELIDQIPAKGLYKTERRRKAFVYLVATRPAFRNEQMAEDLMSSPWWQFWDAVTSEEAFLAYQLVKSMPVRARQAFLKARGGEKWGQVIDELPANIRESASFNLYDGGETQKDRQAFLIQLLDDNLWTAASSARLDATIRMALAAGEGEFVFEQSRIHDAAAVKGLEALVKKYDLFKSGEHEQYKEKELEGHAWYEEGFFSKMANFGRLLKMLGRYIVSDEANLAVLHRYGGVPTRGDKDAAIIRGMRMEDATDKEEKEAKAAGKLPPNVLKYLDKPGETTVEMSEFVIAKLAVAGGKTLTGAPVVCKGIYLSLQYAIESKKPYLLQAGFDELSVSDFAMIGGDSMISINSISLKGVRLRMTNESFEQTEAQDGLGAMFSVFLEPKQAMGVRLAFESMVLNGVATSGGTFVEKVEIGGLTVQSGGNASSYQDALRSSASRLKKRFEEEQKAEKDDPAHAADHQEAQAQLRKQLSKTNAELKREDLVHGAVIDIRSIKVSGLAGLSEDSIDLSDVHGQGASVTAVVPLFADPTSLRNMIRGSEAASTLKGKQKGESEFSLDIANIKNKKPLRLVGAIPSAQKAKSEFDDFVAENRTSRFKDGYQTAHDALEQRAKNAAEYESLASKGVQHLKAEKGETDRFRSLRQSLTEFEERRATIIEKLALSGVTANFSGDGNPELIAETLAASGIKTFAPDGHEKLTIGEVTGSAVHVSAVLDGGLANAKEWRKNLRSAELRAQSLTIKDIRHTGSGAIIEELSFEGDAESEGLNASFDRGDAASGGTQIGVKSRKLTAKNINIPAHAALLRAEAERILSIPEAERLPEEQKRLATIEEMLRDLGRIQGSKEAAEKKLDATKSKAERASAQKQITRSAQDLKEWENRLVVEKLTIDRLDILISGLGDVLADDYDYDRDAGQVSITGRGKAGQWWDQLEAANVHNRTAKGDQVVARRITVGPVSGTLEPTKTGFKFKQFKVASLAVQGVAYTSGEMKVQSIGESKLQGVAIDAEISSFDDRTELKLDAVDIDRVIADQLKYEDADKRVTVKSGELIGIHVVGMNVVMPNDKNAKTKVTGGLSVDAAKAVTVNAVASGYHVNATVNAAQPSGKEAHALSVDFAESGEVTVALKGIAASLDVQKLGSKNKVYVELKNLSGKVINNGDQYRVEGLTLGNLTLSRMHWEAEGKTINIDEQVVLRGISLDAEAALEPVKRASKPASKDASVDPDAMEAEPEKKLSKLLVKRLVVDEIDAKQVSVTIPHVDADKSKGIAESPRKSFLLERAVVKGLKVTGFDVLNTTGKIEVAKSTEVTNLRATIGEVARGQITSVTASAKVYGKDAEEPGKGGRELSATLMGKDGTIIRMGRADSLTLTDLWMQSTKSTKKGTATSQTNVDRISLAGITTGDILVKDDFVEVSDITIEGPVGIVGVNWATTGAARQKFSTDVFTIPDEMKIGNIRADFKKVPTGKIVEGKEETRSELNKLSVSSISIPKIVGLKLHYEGPLESKAGTKNVELDMPLVTILGVDIRSIAKDFTTNLLSVNAKLKGATADNFTVKLMETVGSTTKTKKFGADLSTGEIRANAMFRTTNPGKPDEATELESGGFEIDTIGLREITGRFSEFDKAKKRQDKDQTLDYDSRFAKNLPEGQQPGVDLNTVAYNKKTGVSVGSTSIRGVKYKDPNYGLTIDVQEALIPKTMNIPTKGPVTIPQAKITNAYFRIADVMALKKGGGGDSDDTPADEQYYNILDHVHGNFKSNIYCPIHLFDVSDDYEAVVRQQVFPLDVDISRGRFNYEKVEDHALWLRNDVFVSLQMDTDHVKSTWDGRLEPDMSKSYLALEVGGHNVKEWTPSSAEERKEMLEKQVRLKRIIRPDDHDTKAEEEKKKEKEKADKAAGKKGWVEPDEIELRNVDAKLGLRGYIPLGLGATGRIGIGTPGGDALTDLILKSESTRKLLWSVKRAALTIEELNIGGNQIKGDRGKAATIRINDIVDGSISFEDGKVTKPTTIEGTISDATVENLAVVLGE